MAFFLHNGYQHIHRKGDPDLGENRVFGGAVKGFDPQMLFEPQRKKSSTCQRQRYRSATVIAGIVKLLVRKTRRRAVSGSTNLTRRSLSG